MAVKNISDQLKLDSNLYSKISSLFTKTDKNHEFELSMNNRLENVLNMETFLKVLEYLNLRSKIKKEKIIKETTLDIILNLNSETYRVSLINLETIQKYLLSIQNKKPHLVVKILLGKMLQGEKNIQIIKKKRLDVIDIDDYHTRCKLAEEKECSKSELDKLKKIDETTSEKIIIRYKQRVSLFVDNNKDLRIDLTNVKQMKNVNNIEKTFSQYELEIDYMGKNDKKMLDKIFSQLEILLKVVFQSNFVISYSEEKEVLSYYFKKFDLENKTNMILDGRKPISLELIHLLDKLQNRYAVTDKADGDRYFLIIYKMEVFMISNTLRVKKTGLTISDKKYDGSVLDGEYIFLPKHNRHIFMAFDCLFKGDTDVRKISTYIKRLESADEIIEKCFVPKGEKYFKMKRYDGKFDTDNILKFYSSEIEKYMEYLNKIIQKDKKHVLIMRKFVIDALGGKDNEIFKYADLIWNKYVFDKNINCPYILDGVIYSPLEQKYVTSKKDSKLSDFKQKPVNKNSLDLYVIFEKNPETGKVLTVYDDSDDETVKGKPYRIANLHVGRSTKFGEKPVLFQEHNRKHKAFLYLQDGEVRDETGSIIKDNTVVEFYYNIESGVKDTHRWIPMRTRYDKTELVQKYKKGYGNYFDIANKIWRSITNPVTFKDISKLGNDELFNKHLDFLRGRVDHSLILSENRENIYNRIRKKLGQPMRNFHNWISSILIYTYCNQIYQRGRSLTVLDLGCGRGDEIMKFYYTMIEYYVGIDIDLDSIMSVANGAVSRYNELRKSHPNFPKYTFIQADAGVPLNFDKQSKAIGRMNQQNKSLMDKYFSSDSKKRTKFDRINCSYAIENFLINETVWKNFINNVNDHLKEDGFFIISCFDTDRIKELLKDTDKYTIHYNTEKGEKMKLFELIKKYTNNSKSEYGNSIEYHNSFEHQEDVYNTEYLVNRDFLVKEFENKHFELVFEDSFINQYNIHQEYFKYIYQFEENQKTKNFFKKVAEYYDKTIPVNSACLKLTELFKMYVFRKKPVKIQTGGSLKDKYLNRIDELSDFELYTLNDSYKKTGYSLMDGIVEGLKLSKEIPSSLSSVKFYDDLGIDYTLDQNLNDNLLEKILKKIKIYNGRKKTIDGLNLTLLEKGCDNLLEFLEFGNTKSKKTLCLIKKDNKYRVVLNKELKTMIDKENYN